MPRSPAPTTSAVAERVDGYLPLRDYAVIGDGRTAALVGRDGSVDWLCLPDVDSGAIFARVLDAGRGGSFELCPAGPFSASRAYQPLSNVLETTFRTADGAVRVTDALTLADRSWLSPLRELVRRVECLEGEVELEWLLEPRPGYGLRGLRFGRRAGRIVATDGRDALALGLWGAGTAEVGEGAARGRFRLSAGETALLSLAASNREPLVLPGRYDTELRLRATERFWPRWAEGNVRYEGRWREQVERSALVLKLLCFAPSGAMLAAPTTSLPEWIGGARNWDYRFSWIRDSAFAVTALLRLGCTEEARAYFWWLMHATALTQPDLRPLYRVNGSLECAERELGHLEGYRGSRPVRIGNRAAAQVQLDVYGPMLEAVWLYACATGEVEAERGRTIAKIADHVADVWRRPDSGIWEVRSEPSHFTQSKAMCWVALDRACRLAARGFVPDRSARWRAEADAIRRFVDERLYDEQRGAYVRSDAHRAMDASLLTLALFEYLPPDDPRLVRTVEAVRAELADGPFVRRYDTEDGLDGPEGAFLTCSFWLAGALAKAGRVDEARALMDDLCALANDVGLYAEEIGPDGEFLGNVPQALSHLALVNAAVAVERAEEEAA